MIDALGAEQLLVILLRTAGRTVRAAARPHPKAPGRWQPVIRINYANGAPGLIAVTDAHKSENAAIEHADRIIDQAEEAL